MIQRDRFSNIVKTCGIIGPPDLVIEILSTTFVKRDKVSKVNTYAKFSVPEYWVVDPKISFLSNMF